MDRQLREHLRAWEATGDPEAERQYVVARLRRGDLSRGAVECAAYVGDAVCGELLGAGARRPGHGILEFVAGLPTPDHEVSLRAGLLVLDAWTPGEADWSTTQLDLVDAVRTWLECPCAEHRTSIALAEGPLRGDDAFGLRGWLAAVLPGDGRCGAHGVACPGFAVPARGHHPDLRARLATLLVPWVLTRDVPAAWKGCY